MRKVKYWVIATWSVVPDKGFRHHESVIVSGEDQLSALVNSFIERKLKKLHIEIQRTT
jgi:hypothetical protein